MSVKKFFKHRLTRRRFTGLPLTVLVIIATVFAYLLIKLAEEVLGSESVIVADMFIVDLISKIRTPVLTDFFAVITTLGVTEFIVATVIGVSIILLVNKSYNSILAFWFTVGGTALITYLAKQFFARPRPELALYTEKLYSFPSGHASLSVALYGFIAYLIWRNTKSKKTKTIVTLITISLIALIGLSRLYLGVHYLSDVVEGFLLGGTFLIFGIIFAEIYKPILRQLQR